MAANSDEIAAYMSAHVQRPMRLCEGKTFRMQSNAWCSPSRYTSTTLAAFTKRRANCSTCWCSSDRRGPLCATLKRADDHFRDLEERGEALRQSELH
jgi:hypothetical protein